MSLVNKFLSNITQIKHAVKVSDQNSPVLDCSLNYSHENLNKNLFPLCTNMHREKKQITFYRIFTMHSCNKRKP